MYSINDKDVRHALSICNKTINACTLAKENKQTIIYKRFYIKLQVLHTH